MASEEIGSKRTELGGGGGGGLEGAEWTGEGMAECWEGTRPAVSVLCEEGWPRRREVAPASAAISRRALVITSVGAVDAVTCTG